MQKTYETPVLTTEPFDARDAVTASAPGADGLASKPTGWEIPTPTGDVIFY